MIDKIFWKKIADNWMKKTDGINTPGTDGAGADVTDIDPDEDGILFDDITDDEIDDILSELGLDDI